MENGHEDSANGLTLARTVALSARESANPVDSEGTVDCSLADTGLGKSLDGCALATAEASSLETLDISSVFLHVSSSSETLDSAYLSSAESSRSTFDQEPCSSAAFLSQAGVPPANGACSLGSSSETIDSACLPREAVTAAEPDGIPSCAAFLMQTAIPPSNGALSSDSSSVDETQQATIDLAQVTAGATSDLGSQVTTRLARTIPDVFAGATWGGKTGPEGYEILGELGRGGMGVVYKARHRRLNRLVALKMIRGADVDEVQIARFKIEAEAVATLRHPNILQIYDIGEYNAAPYVALELLEGGSLLDRLRATLLPPRQAAEWMVPLVLAMDAAHKAGIVHRDLKPANVLFSSDGVPKVTDFGLAKRLEDDEGQTRTGQVMGTPSYMAPEQARGDTKLAGPAADIYSLGAILYEMLTGRPPFRGVSVMDTVKQVLEVEPISPSRVQYRVPRDLETICLKCLQKEPRKRYGSAKEMAADLNRYLLGEPIQARRTPMIERGIKWTRRHPAYALTAVFSAITTITVLGVGAWQFFAAMQLEADTRKATTDDLLHAQGLISSNALDASLEVLRSRASLIKNASRKSRELAGLYDRTKRMLNDVDRLIRDEKAKKAEEEARRTVQNSYLRFLDLRKEALFRDTQFTGLMLPTDFELTRKGAEQALGVFGRGSDSGDWTLGELPPSLSSEQQTEINEGCYELLLVKAEAMAKQGPAHVDAALRTLDSASRLRPEDSRAYHMRRASCLTLKGDKALADKELAIAQKISPKSAFDYFLIGQQEYKSERYSDAIQDFEIALQRKPGQFWAKCLQGICYIHTGEYKGAKSSLDGCIQTDPSFAWLYLVRGLANGQLGARYKDLFKTSQGRETILEKRAEVEFGEAEVDFQHALELLRSRPDQDLQYILLINRGLIRFQRGRFDLAAADYGNAIRLKKDPFLAHAELAHVYKRENKPELAIEQFTRAISFKPNWPPLYRGRAEVLQAFSTNDASRRARALADLTTAIQNEKPDNPVLAKDYADRGALLYLDGRFEDALKESRQALGIVPNYLTDSRMSREFRETVLNAHALEVKSLLKLRRYDELFRACDGALTMGRKSPVLHELRAAAHAAKHNYPAAIRDYGLAIELLPDNGRLHAERGWVYLVFESPKLALVDFEAAIKLNPTDGDAYNGRGTARALLGNHAAGVADAREAIRLGGASSRVKYNAARVYAAAASAVAAEVRVKGGRQARQLSARYEDIALELIREEFKREAPEKRLAFWKETVQSDPAFKAIRRRIKLDDLL